MEEERRTLRLSDAFETDTGAGEYEWTAATFYMNTRSLLQKSKDTGIPWN